MYRKHYGFRRLPFDRDVPAEDLFPSPSLDELHSRLTYLVQTRGVAIVTGEPGSGKTTALRRLRASLHPDQVRPLYVFDTAVNAADLYRQIAAELGIEVQWSRAMTLRAIQHEIGRLVKERKLTVLLVLDEAHRLRPDVLAELPLLTNFEWDSANHLALLLSGQTAVGSRWPWLRTSVSNHLCGRFSTILSHSAVFLCAPSSTAQRLWRQNGARTARSPSGILCLPMRLWRSALERRFAGPTSPGRRGRSRISSAGSRARSSNSDVSMTWMISTHSWSSGTMRSIQSVPVGRPM